MYSIYLATSNNKNNNVLYCFSFIVEAARQTAYENIYKYQIRSDVSHHGVSSGSAAYKIVS